MEIITHVYVKIYNYNKRYTVKHIGRDTAVSGSAQEANVLLFR